jgi:hypothetical protein
VTGVSEPQTTATIDIGNGPESLDVTSWSVKRDLTGGALPAQVRAGSGLSVGSGSIEVNVPDGRTPWTSTKVAPGGAVTIDAATDVGVDLSPVARMCVRDVGAGSALSTARSSSIEDSLAGMRGLVTLPVSLAVVLNTTLAPIDASWAIVQAARAGGFLMDPLPVASCIASLPGRGSAVPDVGVNSQLVYASGDVAWTTSADGRIVPADNFNYNVDVAMTRALSVGDSIYATLTIPNDASAVNFYVTSFSIAAHVTVFSSGALWLQHDSGVLAVGTAPGPADPYARVQVQVEFLSTTQTRVRMRRSASSAWSAWVTATGPAWPASTFSTVGVGDAVGAQVHTADDAAVWGAPNAFIAASGSTLSAVLAGSSASAWDLAQQVTNATLGALWLDESGNLNYRAKEALRGLTTLAGEIEASESVVDLPWSISADDVADRVEVTYNPPDVQTATDYSLTLWTSTDVVAIAAGATKTMVVDLDGAADSLAPWLPITDVTTAPAGKWSRWAASTQRDGGGVAPPSTALSVTSTFINPSKVQIRITNNTAGTLYTAGTDATAQLTLRANLSARTGEPITISSGAPAATAQNPLSVDLGSWVQDDDYAQSLLSWLTSMTAQALPVLDSVQVVPDLDIRLGDVRILRDPEHTELVAKVLVVGVDLAGSAGSLTQTLRLAVLGILNTDVGLWLTPWITNTQAAALVTAALTSAATNTQAAEFYAQEVVA